ncbi:hypothetical protein EYF80_027153 [Liparis tanakae]|uniref:Uncharacterized protein n=1 Tax=Liparis tanakae TaxID=230148 RepID=A0A4Z2HBI9_9TELE|nr:hypothetical protein EYF80_027153 [Liparis tanakae]
MGLTGTCGGPIIPPPPTTVAPSPGSEYKLRGSPVHVQREVRWKRGETKLTRGVLYVARLCESRMMLCSHCAPRHSRPEQFLSRIADTLRTSSSCRRDALSFWVSKEHVQLLRSTDRLQTEQVQRVPLLRLSGLLQNLQNTLQVQRHKVLWCNTLKAHRHCLTQHLRSRLLHVYAHRHGYGEASITNAGVEGVPACVQPAQGDDLTITRANLKETALGWRGVAKGQRVIGVSVRGMKLANHTTWKLVLHSDDMNFQW